MDWFEGLNPEQTEAAHHLHGPLLILAGAGSGKTTTLVSRTGHLIDSGVVAAHQMLVLTFTNKAARELKDRVLNKLGKKSDKLIAGTFHSFGLSLLRKFHKETRLDKHFGIIDQSDATNLVKELLLDLKNSAKSNFDADVLFSRMSHWRDHGQTKAKTSDEYEIAVEWLLPRYLKKLDHLGVVDFDSLILKPLELLRSNESVLETVHGTHLQVMVDEFQDTNTTQMKLIDTLVKVHNNITVVGDDDQSIYGWRGAQVANILNFPKVYKNCRVIKLVRNYRSSVRILNLANYVIEKNQQRHGKKLMSLKNESYYTKPELFVFENDDLETEGVIREIRSHLSQNIPPNEIAVLYRSNSLGAMIEIELRKQQLPYSISGGTAFFDRREIKDILAYLRCAVKPNDISIRRILNTPHRGIGESTYDELISFSRNSQVSFYEATKKWRDASINAKSGSQIDAFLSLIGRMEQQILCPDKSPGQNLLELLDHISYKKHLELTSKDHFGVLKRWNLVETFVQVFDKLMLREGRATREKLLDFLNFMELKYVEPDEKTQCLQLMTLHASKGLEFDAVILVGLDEDILPHKTLGEDIQEERRLFYVGITRARKHLMLTRCKTRLKHGRKSTMTPSRFIVGIPEDLMVIHGLGWRPVNENQRQEMLAELYKKLSGPSA